ncbi:MAG: putative ATPase, partial [Parvicellaceae bacterium]
TTDSQRVESVETARAIAGALRSSYSQFGFNLVEIPTGSIGERADFILNQVMVPQL